MTTEKKTIRNKLLRTSDRREFQHHTQNTHTPHTTQHTQHTHTYTKFCAGMCRFHKTHTPHNLPEIDSRTHATKFGNSHYPNGRRLVAGWLAEWPVRTELIESRMSQRRRQPNCAESTNRKNHANTEHGMRTRKRKCTHTEHETRNAQRDERRNVRKVCIQRPTTSD